MNTNKELKQLEKGIKLARKTLSNAPKGRLQLSSSRKTVQFYVLEENGKKTYLSKVNDRLLNKYAQKVYSEKFLKTAERLKQQITSFTDFYDEHAVTAVFDNLNNELKKHVKPFILTDEQFAEEWGKQEYETRGIRDDQIFYTTENGEKVRSKSELTIANKLFIKGIKYRYEEPHYMKGFGTIYPDFTILNAHTREEIIWEHFGLMNNPEFQTYADNGIAPGHGLIVTYESVEVPLDTNTLDLITQNLLIS